MRLRCCASAIVSHIRNLHAHEACRDAGLDFAKFGVFKAANVIAKCLKERYSLLESHSVVSNKVHVPDSAWPAGWTE